MNGNWKSIKVGVLGKEIPLLWVLFIVLIVGGFSLVQTWQNQGKWRTFDSRGKFHTARHPDFKLDYPATWDSDVYQGYFRSTENVWADFGGNEFYTTFSGLLIYWRPLSNPTINELSTWGQEIIEVYKGYNVSQMEEAQVGVEDYPAFIQTFQADRTYMVVYILDKEGGYILLFDAKPYAVETENLFKQILASFQILETQE